MGQNVKSSRWHSCNVLRVGADGRQLWQFAAGNGEVTLSAEQTRLPSERLPDKIISKNWQSIWQRKLNIAWLPVGQAFLRVIHLPACDFTELLAMVEFQLEKISPLPVAQIVWSVEILPHQTENMQTVVVIIVERGLIEGFLGALEGDGYLADRLELPFLQQVTATHFEGDGTWIFLNAEPGKAYCLVAWWYGGMLQNLGLFPIAIGENGGALLGEQLTKVAWAGEIEGWLTSAPRWHLVADDATAAIWEPALSQWAGEKVEVIPLLPPSKLAALSAQHAAQPAARANLMPSEFSTRYRQQFIDRLWMRGLFAVGAVYVVGVLIYLGALEVLKLQHGRVQAQADSRAGAFTNALQLEAKVRILQEQASLRYAALDCWKAVSELLPPELSLQQIVFQKGKILTLYGSAPAEDQSKITEFNSALSKAALDGIPMFSKVNPASIIPQGGPQGISIARWNFSCEIKRSEFE